MLNKKAFVFIGPPSAGKTTLIKMLCSFFGWKRCTIDARNFSSTAPFAFSSFEPGIHRAIHFDNVTVNKLGHLYGLTNNDTIEVNRKYKPAQVVDRPPLFFECNGTANEANSIRDSFNGRFTVIEVNPSWGEMIRAITKP